MSSKSHHAIQPVGESAAISEQGPPPLVIVEGFLGGFGTQTRWGDFQNHWTDDSMAGGSSRRRRAIFVSVGPVSSLHDRACELFYALKGGTIDYGAEHAAHHGHTTQYGRTIVGSYPEWSKEKPLHFLGHSFGGPTITKMQWLLETGFFGEAYGPDMLLSVNTVSSPFRGTSVVYLLGERVDAAPLVRFWSVGNAITKVVHIISYLSPWTASHMDFHTESRGYSCREASFWSLIKTLWRSDWAESRDIAPYDCTYVSADTREAMGEGAVNPNTFYRSYAASWSTMKNGKFKPPAKDFWEEPVLYHYATPIANFDFMAVRPVPSFVAAMGEDIKVGGEGSEVYRENDGVVPRFSQWHPLPCKQTKCEHFHHSDLTNPSLSSSRENLGVENGSQTLPSPGKWYVYELRKAHHGSIAPTWLDTPRQRAFWKELGRWLRDVDLASGHCSSLAPM
ncbi:alpha/beta-hydrolase [Cristinia sonorae]|uniref:Alpha/beta-hydrolase n=1 Tax=Cristinia sonorae TaxID=1940300 RepID=A0A8K0UM81_9AGAR|nr:alpha/beta-hydrolase [Cristinia sonorae]